MRYKYVITREDSDKLSILENIQIEGEDYHQIDTRRVDGETIRQACRDGVEAVIRAVRTRQFFPPSETVARIAQAIIQMYAPGNENLSQEVLEEQGARQPEGKRPEPLKDEIDDDPIDEDVDDDVVDEDNDDDVFVDELSEVRISDDDEADDKINPDT